MLFVAQTNNLKVVEITNHITVDHGRYPVLHCTTNYFNKKLLLRFTCTSEASGRLLIVYSSTIPLLHMPHGLRTTTTCCLPNQHDPEVTRSRQTVIYQLQHVPYHYGHRNHIPVFIRARVLLMLYAPHFASPVQMSVINKSWLTHVLFRN